MTASYDKADALLREIADTINPQGQHPELANKLRSWLTTADQINADRRRYAIYADAAQLKTTSELEVDGDPLVSPTDDEGVWVNAWLWVSDDEARRAAR